MCHIKYASDVGSKAAILNKLLAAKGYSDAKQYKRKHRLMSELIAKHPGDFYIDSRLNPKYIGLTHKPTNFKMHLPDAAIPREVSLPYVEQKNP